MKPFVSDR